MEANLRQVMQAELIGAMKSGDRTAVSALRGALAAVANREAVDPPARPRSHNPVSDSGEVPRRQLSPAEVKLVVTDEVAQLRNSAEYLATGGRNEDASAREAEAAVLERILYLT